MEHQQARVESSQSDYSQQIADNIQTLQTLALALNTGGNDFSQSPALSPARSSISDILNASELSDYFRQINDAVHGLNDYISPQNSPAASSALDETFQNTESQSDYSQQIINSIQILQTIASALNTGGNDFTQSPALNPVRSPISDILNASEVSDYFRQIDDAVRGLNNCISPQNSPVGSPAASSSISLDEGFQNTESVLPSETVSAANDQAQQQQQQQGGNLDQNQRIERQRFNNIEIRRSLSITPPTHAVPDIAEFYTTVMNVLTDLANTARSIAERNDFVQLELVWDNISHHINISVTDNDAILPAFEEFLDELVQSNAELPSESNLELILQIVKNPTGGVKRKAEKTLECELINKKRRHLYIVENTGNKLCFATSLAHVANPEFTDKQALEQGRKWQHQAGLTDQTAVTFSDVAKFENILQRKIVVFHRTSKDRALSKFETDFQIRSNPCFLLLHNNHFYGIRNLAGFTGSKYICKFCYGCYNNSNTHHCQGYCGVCSCYSCTQLQYNPVRCDDCNRICRNSTCFDRHKEPRNRPHAEMLVSDCEMIKFCSTCNRLYHIPMTKEKTFHVCGSKCVICGDKNLPPDSYGVKLMNPDERQKITDWYGEASKGIFDFEKESLHYCKNDVDILFQGCVKFREEFFKETNVDPFKNITIASACMQVFVTNFLPEKSLAIPSAVDYRRGSKTFSNASIQWLEWKMDSENLQIEHALNSGERKIGPYFVDGFAVISGLATVFSFNGCLYHACPRCFKQTEMCPLRKVPFEQIYAATIERSKILQAVYGVRVETVWEHEWDEMKKSDPGVIRFLEKFDAPEPLVPRNALYGGRTCALKLRFTAGPGESVHYVDFTSLYPYVNATCEYPLGHPTLIYKDFDDPVNYFGFIRATILTIKQGSAPMRTMLDL
ncbi:uncharacterized protein LOC114139628 [Xiphophorus couchianus]|uniref:uncharacterized protein LOC114139628 n=1 Tax=Xiphophorus couchianus TaxID=32473 RepID=UPI001016BD9D|nr:uncharacterized protein LOC114139628 [Xiphophorus couchianus]